MSSPSLKVEVDAAGDIPVGITNQVAVPQLPPQDIQVVVPQNDGVGVGANNKSVMQRESEGFVAFNKRFEDW